MVAGWLIFRNTEKKDIVTMSIREEDMKLIPIMDAGVNEEIKAHFDGLEREPASDGSI